MAKSIDFFHAKPENWNCAQAVQKGFQQITGLTDEEIELQYRPKGGGRAEEGLCGALYAAEQIAKEKGLPSIKQEFIAKAGGCTCKCLKQELQFPCADSVNLAEELLTARLVEKLKGK
ncbi:Uncharacterised protein [Porphyromonas macacae]|uniref:Redox-active protein (C_GCAxxG_C_C) n=1 Tax=Porphyromonas macacae TaxID=28115 RepID=A0A379DH36_9PORP|nr:hypothetical protein [Porphyromonas macacae]SUB77297.1 Uncharacterised protein [Porphyromonas macacae]